MSDKILQILLVEDNPTDALLLRQELEDTRSASFQLTHVERLSHAFEQLSTPVFDAVLLDLGLPDSQGFQSFHLLHVAYPDVPIVVLTGLNDEELAVRAVHEGAEDYLVKGEVPSQLLTRAILYAIERKRTRQQLRKSREFYLSLLEEFPALIWRANTEGQCDYFNKTWLEFTGRTLEQELGEGWTQSLHPDDLQQCMQTYQVSFAALRPFNMEYRLRRYDGEYRWVADHGRPFHDVEGAFAGYLGACYDITQQKQHEQQIEEQHRQLEKTNEQLEKTNVELVELASTDALTQLRNRRYFMERLEGELRACMRSEAPFSIILMDLDRFKHYNDSFGHPAGDVVLRSVATILQNTFRPTDVCARYGGEEFIILLPSTGHDGAVAAGQRCRASIEQAAWPFRAITASFGVSTYLPGMDYRPLIEDADRALYHCKQQGRNCVAHAFDINVKA
jgi:diguanylate cyclase (GGDEF)-like protein/PAS domain S-box-containing protein